MKKIATCIILIAFLALSTAKAQNQQVENKPYIDLRPLHFGIHVGFHAQDINFVNVGPQTVTLPDGTTATQTILCDADKWNPGLSVGVLADLRLTDYLSCTSGQNTSSSAISLPPTKTATPPKRHKI